jgi:uncharacterized DUF497 family protein
VKYFDWDEDKNQLLIELRGISFEECVEIIKNGDDILDIVQNHSPYNHQKVYIIEIDGYAYEVPYVEDDEKFFLKTIYKSHEATKKYLPTKDKK